MSENMALFITVIEPMKKPWLKRADSNRTSFGKMIGNILEMTNNRHDRRRRVFRPRASVINPIIKLPRAYPQIYKEIINLVVLAEIFKARPIAGSDGANKSIVIPDNGKNDSKINISIFLFVILLCKVVIFCDMISPIVL